MSATSILPLQIDVKTPSRPPGFAFVEFDDPRDALDACRGRDGYNFAGGKIRVIIGTLCEFV